MSEIFTQMDGKAEAWSEERLQNALAEPSTLAVSADDFSALEERVRRAVELVKQERQAKAEAEERATRAEEKLHTQSPMVEQLQNELTVLRAERDQVRQRVERLMKQLDALEL